MSALTQAWLHLHLDTPGDFFLFAAMGGCMGLALHGLLSLVEMVLKHFGWLKN